MPANDQVSVACDFDPHILKLPPNLIALPTFKPPPNVARQLQTLLGNTELEKHAK